MVSGEGGDVSEPRPIYNTLDDNDIAKIRKASIDGEPLSTKQLHELITSQAMTIDRLYGEIAKRDDDIKVLEFENNEGLYRLIELIDALYEIDECLHQKKYKKAKRIIENKLT